jgi:hypothetical protein
MITAEFINNEEESEMGQQHAILRLIQLVKRS